MARKSAQPTSDKECINVSMGAPLRFQSRLRSSYIYAMTIVKLFSKCFSLNGIDDWYVFLVHVVQSLVSECMAHVNILIVAMDRLS